MSYITEAFKALECLNEETFAISDDGINKLAQFEQSDDLSDDITVYDMDAETEDDLEDSYVGKVILDCCVCHSKIYKDKSEVSIDEEQGIANMDMECPYCYSQEGFKVIGEVAPMTAEESTSETSAEPETDPIEEGLFGKKKKNEPPSTFKVIDSQHEFTVKGGFKSKDDAYNWIENNKEPKDHSLYKVVQESLNEASTDRVQKLLSIIDNSFEVLEDTPINEDALEEAKQIRLSSIPGVTRDPSNDFTDDGNRFQAYLYKGVVPITYLRAGEDVYITIAFHHLKDINYDEYKEFPSYKNADEFNGVPVDTFNAEIFQKNLEDAYKDIFDFLGSVEDVDSAQLEDRITSINNACKEYEEKVKQYIQDNALKIMKLSDYQFRNLKNYVSSAGNRTADYIRNASSSSQRHFMSRDLESLKRQISNSWNFEYIEDILNSVQESITESPALSKVTGTLGAALDAHKEELANATTSEALVELLNRIRPKVKEGQQAYLDSVIERVKRLPAIKGMQFVYNLILKGDGMSTKLDAAKPRKKAANESLEEVEVKTGDTKVEVSSDEDGKITVSSEPCETKETPEDNAEVIKPISDETRDSIENGETDVDIEDMDTDAFDELGESYLKRVYENVSAYKTSKVSTQDNKFVVEGLITFDTGNQKSTSFVFESANCTKDGKLKFIGENMQIAKGEKAFSLIGTADNKKFVTESFNYNYRAKNNIGKSTRLYGTIKRG